MDRFKKILKVAVPILLGLLLLIGGMAWRFAFHGRGLIYDIDARGIAASETRMWKAYYNRDAPTLAGELVLLLRQQFGLSRYTALFVSKDLSEAALTFAGSSGAHERTVLPILERAYTRIHDATGGGWNPRAVAKAELAWWVARRTPGSDSAESVGRIIATEYALLYGQTNPNIEKAGLLRARAAVLRDKGGSNADWAQVQRLLEASYLALADGVGIPSSWHPAVRNTCARCKQSA